MINKYVPTSYEEKYKNLNVFTYDTMVELHYDAITCANAARRAEWYSHYHPISLFKEYLQYAFTLEDCILNEWSPDRVFRSDFYPRSHTLCERFKGKIEWILRIKVFPIFKRILSVIFWIFSIMIIILEGTIGLSSVYDEYVFAFFDALLSGTYTKTLIVTLIIMGYLCFCTYYGIFNFRVSGFYGLYPYHQTDPSNLVYSALYLAKLASPLCLNFLMLIHFENHRQTVFDKVAGKGMSWAFVNNFLEYFPCLTLVLCLLYYFDVYSKVMKVIGMDEYTYYNFYDPHDAASGIQILKEERIKLLKKKANAKDKPKRVVFCINWIAI